MDENQLAALFSAGKYVNFLFYVENGTMKDVYINGEKINLKKSVQAWMKGDPMNTNLNRKCDCFACKEYYVIYARCYNCGFGSQEKQLAVRIKNGRSVTSMFESEPCPKCACFTLEKI